MVKHLSVKNFGPIKEADIEFGDITLLIGPQNSGKTILATLIYTLNRAVYYMLENSIIDILARHLGEKYGDKTYYKEEVKKIVSEDANEIYEKMYKESGEWFNLLHSYLESHLRSNYQIPPEKLVRTRCDKSEIEYTDEYFTVKTLIKSDGKLQSSFIISRNIIKELINFSKYIENISVHKKGQSYSGHYGLTPSEHKRFYIPAERMYLLHYLADILDLVLEIHEKISSRFVTEQQINIYALKKTFLDYVRQLNMITRVPRNFEVLDLGKVVISNRGIITFYDHYHDITVPLYATGSGITQLIGIILPLSIINLDFVVIEEPEINLHADMQLRVAEYLADVSKLKNIQMVLTTHSENFLAKMAHLYAKDAINDLKAYFLNGENGIAEKLEISKETGEAELPESIRKAIEALSEEALELTRLP